ncbi:BglG family transcription antiterminator [Salinicoccus sp. HZC-1]|uniref:BglG family transcription antiterminator n=1 Tax=Salinicoccus sp. HZC-1 TaxID=3385497 RepID=UPI00398AC44E
MLNKNHLKIIDVLLLKNISIQELSHNVNISERTLANYVGQINDSFEGAFHITKKHGYYAMTVFNKKSFIHDVELLRKKVNEHNEETEKRTTDIFQILIKNAVNTIDDISEELYLSKSMVHNILNEIKSIVEKYNVEIKGKPNVGLVVKGSEFKIRKILVENFSNHYKAISLPHYFSEYLTGIKKQYKLDSDTYGRLETSLKVTIDRLKRGYYIDEDLNVDNQVFQSKDYQHFEDFILYIKKEFEVINPRYEILLIVLQLLGRRASIIDEIIDKDDDSLIQSVIDNTIDDINDSFTIKINEDLFSKDIRLHLKYLIDRLLFDVKVSNESVGDVQQRFPFAYELSKVLAENIEKEIDIQVPINELDFLSIYFSIFLDELEQKMRDINSVAIITNQGLSTSKIIKMNLQQILNDDVEISVFNLEEVDEEIINAHDLILSTTQTNRLFNKVIYIEDVLDRQLLKLKIEQFLIYKDVNNIKLFNQSILFDYLSEEDIYHFYGKNGYFDIVKELSSELVKENEVDSEFVERILSKEKDKPTINNRLGFPHAVHSLEKINIKIAVLDDSLADYENLKIIILMAIPEMNVNEAVLIRLYEEILSLAANDYLMNTISGKTGFKELAHILNQEMRK